MDKLTMKLCWTVVAAALLGLTCISGCGGPYNSSAKGTVTLDGTILTTGWINFHPASGGPIAHARIEESGSYVARTGDSNGLPAGDYQVTIIAHEPPKELRSKDGGPPPAGKQITPTWYANKDQSGLNLTVKPGRNEINLELSTKPPAGWNPAKKS
jgi:hypothetical protein